MGWLAEIDRIAQDAYERLERESITGGVNKPKCKHRNCIHAICCDCGMFRHQPDPKRAAIFDLAWALVCVLWAVWLLAMVRAL